MHQPLGFVDPDHLDHVCRLRKSLYGLKQAPRAWFQRFAKFIISSGFCGSVCDQSIFVYQSGSETAYLPLDDIILTASTDALLCRFIDLMKREFAMSDLGPLHHFLGINFTRSSSGLFLSQSLCAQDIIACISMTKCNPVSTPVDTDSKLSATYGPAVSDPTLYRSLAGALQYLTFTRPDIAYAVQQVCLFMHDPQMHALKRIIRYLQGTTNHGLMLTGRVVPTLDDRHLIFVSFLVTISSPGPPRAKQQSLYLVLKLNTEESQMQLLRQHGFATFF